MSPVGAMHWLPCPAGPGWLPAHLSPAVVSIHSHPQLPSKMVLITPFHAFVLAAQEHLDYDLVESSNPAFGKAIVRVNVFRNHRQVRTLGCNVTIPEAAEHRFGAHSAV